MYLNVSTTEMAQDKVNAKYYALAETEATECKELSSCNSENTKKEYDIVTFTTDGGDDDTVYSCSGSVEITATGEMYTAEDALVAGDVTLEFTNLDGKSSTDSIDLYSLKSSEGSTTREISFDITGNKSQSVKASVMLENQNADQNKIAGKGLTISINTTNAKCEIKQPGD